LGALLASVGLRWWGLIVVIKMLTKGILLVLTEYKQVIVRDEGSMKKRKDSFLPETPD